MQLCLFCQVLLLCELLKEHDQHCKLLKLFAPLQEPHPVAKFSSTKGSWRALRAVKKTSAMQFAQFAGQVMNLFLSGLPDTHLGELVQML